MVTLSVTMAPNVKEILDMAESIGNKETTSFLSNCLEGKHANVASIKTKLCSLQAEEKRLRRLGPKGKEKLENFFAKCFPFPARPYEWKNPQRSVGLFINLRKIHT